MGSDAINTHKKACFTLVVALIPWRNVYFTISNADFMDKLNHPDE